MLKRQRDRQKQRLILAALAAVVLVGGFMLLRSRSQTQANGTTYEFGKVTRGDVRNFVTATGTIQPWKTVDVKSNIAGRIDRLAVDLGDRVEAGQLIAIIDPTDAEAAVKKADADLASARARAAQARVSKTVQPALTSSAIKQAQAGVESARKSLEQSKQSRQELQQQLAQLQDVTIPQNLEDSSASLDEARASAETAQAEYDRQVQLLEKGYSSSREVEQARSQLATRKAALRTARQRAQTIERQNQIAVSQLKSKLAQSQASIEESQARLAQQQATERTARTNAYQDDVKRQDYLAALASIDKIEAERRQAAKDLQYTRIVAPRSGVVIAKNVEEGTVVPSSRGSIGSTNALLQIGDTSRLWVVCQVDETDIGQIRVGQRTAIIVDAYPSLRVDGRVIRVDPQATVEQNVTTIPVTVEINEPDPRFKPEMNAECEFIVEEVKNVLTVPNEAVIEENGKYSVQELVASKTRTIAVEVGVAGQEATEIRSGLREGQEVITRTFEPEAAEAQNPFAMRRPTRRTSGGMGAPGSSGQRTNGSTGGAGGSGGPPGGGGPRPPR